MQPNSVWTLQFDGSCNPNPGGLAAYGYIISHRGEQVKTEHAVIGKDKSYTNNFAEHYAVAKGLEQFLAIHFNNPEPNTFLHIRGDSNLVIKQINREWGAKQNKAYYYQYVRVMALVKEIRKLGVTVSAEWVPREFNQDCDDLSKKHLKYDFIV